jgi:small subunit ribosomal protein S11
MAEDKKQENKKPEEQNSQESNDSSSLKRSAPKKKHGKTVAFGVVHISCTFNNTIITITDDKGNTLAWATAGGCGFKGTKKGTPFAAQITSSKACAKAADMGVKQVSVLVCGPGPGRETAIRAVEASGLHVVSIKDVTPIPHNGCRPPKARRV